MVGTDARDILHAGRGDDRVAARAGNDWVDGGLGDDVVFGGAGWDFVFGGPGDDRLIGGNGVYAGAGDDVIDARDRRAGRLRTNPTGTEFVRGGAGNDRIFTRDDRPDQIECGSGFDVLISDVHDDAVDCEMVLRR